MTIMSSRSLLVAFILVVCHSPADGSPFPYAGRPVPSLETLKEKGVLGDQLATGGSRLSMAVETFFLLDRPPRQTLEQVKKVGEQSFSGSTENFGVDRRGRIGNPASPHDFDTFQLVSSPSRFGFGGSPMLNLKFQELNLSREERQQLENAESGGAVALQKAWIDLFVKRTRSFQQGGLVQVAPYETGQQPFHHQAELVAQLKATPKILQNFKALIGVLMTAQAVSGVEGPVCSWESSKVQGDQTVSLAALVVGSSSNNGYLVAETSFYVTGKYYTSMILYELASVTFEGREQTLVWRGDFVITSSIGFLRGIERAAAEKIMLQEVKNSVEAFIESVR